MKQEILNKYGLTEAEFYKKYPTEAAFRKAHPEDFEAMETFAKGGKLPEGILKARLESHMSPEEVNNYIANYASGGMIKRADGSYSKRGLWDNIRANKGSGKKPTKEMLKQEAKIRAEEKAMGGYMYAKGGLVSSIAGSLENLGPAGDVLMGGAEAAYQAMAPLSMPISTLTGKDLSSMIGYDYQSDLGKKFDKGTDIYGRLSGTAGRMAAPIVGGMVGLPPSVTNMGIQMASQGMNNLINQQTYAYGGELVDLEGPKHSEGGIMLTKNAEVEGGETKLGNYIFSDQLEVPGKKGVTFAKESKRIRNKYKLRKGGDIYDKEQERLELMDLQDMNEEKKALANAEEAFEMAKGGWIKKATESIKRRGTEGVCTGSKFGGPTCPPGSKRYNLAKTFRKMAKNRKHAEGGFVGELYDMGGEIERFDAGGFSNLFNMASEGIGQYNASQEIPTINLDALTGASDEGGGWDQSEGSGFGGVGSDFNWKGAAGMAAPLILGSVGQIFGTVAQNKPLKRQLKELKETGYDKVDYGKVSYDRIKPITLDPTQSLLATDRESRIGRRNAEMAGAGNLATMMANKQIADATAMKQKATTIGEYENANRQIQNAVADRNAAIAQAEQEMNKKLEVEAKIDEAKNKGQYYTDIAALETAIGANRAAGWKGAFGSGSQSASNMFSNQQMLNAMMALYGNPDSQKMLKSFKLFGT